MMQINGGDLRDLFEKTKDKEWLDRDQETGVYKEYVTSTEWYGWIKCARALGVLRE